MNRSSHLMTHNSSDPKMVTSDSKLILQTLDNIEASLIGIHKVINQTQLQVENLKDRLDRLERVLSNRKIIDPL